MATGCISTAQIAGHSGPGHGYQRQHVYHTGNWPHEPVDLQRPAHCRNRHRLIRHSSHSGSGRARLRTSPCSSVPPTTPCPLKIMPLSPDYEREWKAGVQQASGRMDMRYHLARQSCKRRERQAGATSGHAKPSVGRRLPSERWEIGGSGFLGSFNNLLVPTRQANDDRGRVRARAGCAPSSNDPAHRRGAVHRTTAIRSAPSASVIESGYYQTFNRDNVEPWSDIRARGPSSGMTEDGLIANGQSYELRQHCLRDRIRCHDRDLAAHGDLRAQRARSLARTSGTAGPRTYLGSHGRKAFRTCS